MAETETTILVKRIQTEDGIGQVDYNSLANLPVIDDTLKTNSENAIRNKAVATAINNVSAQISDVSTTLSNKVDDVSSTLSDAKAELNNSINSLKTDVENGLIIASNSTNLNGQPASYYAALNTQGISTYTHSRTDNVHNFVGVGNNGKAKMTSDVYSGDIFQINGKTVNAYVGADLASEAMAGDSYNSKWVFFTFDGEQINFSGGGSSKFMPKSGGTFTGNVYFANSSSYKFDTYGDVTVRNVNATGNVTGNKVYGAVYNDYAEFFPRGEETEAGDIIALDVLSDEEKYVKASKGMRIVGIHSNEYSHIIGGDKVENGQDYIECNLPKYIPVGLVGRCHCKVLGKVEKGDFIVPSTLPGVGVAVKIPERMFDVVGFAVESCDNEGINMVKVKLGGA